MQCSSGNGSVFSQDQVDLRISKNNVFCYDNIIDARKIKVSKVEEVLRGSLMNWG
jgi:hypothetical protein